MNLFLFILLIFLCQSFLFGFWFDFSYLPLCFLGVFLGAIIGSIIWIAISEFQLFYEDLHKVDVENKSVLVTGCDSGFGLMLAQSLAKRGIFVFAGVLDLNSEGANILSSNPIIKIMKMDVTKDEEVEEGLCIVKKTLTDMNYTLWAVVNNAGVGHCQMTEFLPIDKLRQLLEVNALGLLRVCQKFLPLLRGHGRIVNLTSIAGEVVSPFLGGYCASKFCAESISDALRFELHPLGIPVITINPQAYKTSILFSSHEVFGVKETNLYGEKFIKKCEGIIKDWVDNASENYQEVINGLESAILNRTYQYKYKPNFIFRMKILMLKFNSTTNRTRTGFHNGDISIPVKTEF